MVQLLKNAELRDQCIRPESSQTYIGFKTYIHKYHNLNGTEVWKVIDKDFGCIIVCKTILRPQFNAERKGYKLRTVASILRPKNTTELQVLPDEDSCLVYHADTIGTLKLSNLA